MMFIKILLSLTITGFGLYFLTHVKSLAQRWQGFYIKIAEKSQGRGGSLFFFNNPNNWKKPFVTFTFRLGVIFLGLLLLIVAYPIVFGPIYF